MSQPVKAFLINLDRDADRLSYMDGELTRLGIAYERIAALRGQELPRDIEAYFAAERASSAVLLPGEIGCYASHLHIMRKVVEEDIREPVLVMEDDLEFADGFLAVLNDLPALPDDWDILRLSNPAKSGVANLGPIGHGGRIVEYWRVPNNTGAYLLRRSGAEKFLAYSKDRFRAVDEDLRRPWEHGLVTYGVLPVVIRSNIFDSSIDALPAQSEVGAAPAAVGRSLPARKRFRKVRGEAWRALTYRLARFGLVGALKVYGRGLLRALFRKVR